MRKITLSFFIILLILFTILMPLQVQAEALTPTENYFLVDGLDYVQRINTLETEYGFDVYVSMKGLAALLKDTSKCFTIGVNDYIEITTGIPCEWGEDEEFIDTVQYAEPQRFDIWVDGQERRYWGFGFSDDLYLSLIDVQLMFDMYIPCDGGVYTIYPNTPFHADIYYLASIGFLDYVGGALLGDIDTGEIYLAVHENDTVSMASTSKLMTFYILAEAIENGEISYDDMVTVSTYASVLSQSTSSHERLSSGQQFALSDGIRALLVESSNECAVAMAEHLCGTEGAFVDRMNAKAQELGLYSAQFYNSHGVSVAVRDEIPIMAENKINAMDMFILTQQLVHKFPWVLDITSLKRAELPTLESSAETTNNLLYNMDNVVGLKTGTTPMAGYNLVALANIDINGETHRLVAMVFRAMDESERFRIPEILFKSKMWEYQQ